MGEYLFINKNKRLNYTNNNKNQNIKDENLIIETLYCGICSSDLKIIKQGHPALTYPIIPGHEIVGKIKKIGTNFSYLFREGLKEDDIVTIYPGITCGRCKYCRSKRYNLCENIKILGFNYNGGFNSIIDFNGDLQGRVHLNKIEETKDVYLFTLAEPVSCIINIFDNLKVYNGDKLLILGAGIMGQLTSVVARYYGVKNTYMMDYSDNNIIYPLKNNFVKIKDDNDEIAKISQIKPDIIIIATSDFHQYSALIEVIPKGARVCYFSGAGNNQGNPLNPNLIHYKEIEIRGYYGNTPLQNKKAVELIKKEKLLFMNFTKNNIYNLKRYRYVFRQAYNRKGKKYIFKFKDY